MEVKPQFDLSTIAINSVGSQEITNKRLCWQAHDSYYDCIDEQVTSGSSGTLNFNFKI